MGQVFFFVLQSFDPSFADQTTRTGCDGLGALLWESAKARTPDLQGLLLRLACDLRIGHGCVVNHGCEDH